MRSPLLAQSGSAKRRCWLVVNRVDTPSAGFIKAAGQRYSWMNASSDWRHGGIMFEQSVQSNDLEIRVFLKVEGVASAAFRDPRIRDTTSGKHAKETGRPRSPNKDQGYTGVEPARDRDFGARSDLLPVIPVRHSTHLQNLGRAVN
jgi:hypothetical protein